MILKFGLVSGIGWIIDFALFGLFVSQDANITIANIVSASAAVIFVYFCSLKPIFQYEGNYIFRKLMIYAMYQAIAIGAASVAVEALSLGLAFSPFFSKIVVTPFTFLSNYVFMHWLSTNQDSADAETEKTLTTAIRERVNDRSGEVLFPEMGLTLYTFIEKLYKESINKEIKALFFLAREGQPLMKLFCEYQKALCASEDQAIHCHYLEVSRRSTFLPSLGPLKFETFNILFRQYKSISLNEFLSSLALESHIHIIANALDLNDEELSGRQYHDLRENPLFKRLLDSQVFQHIYESERIARRNALISYMRKLAGTDLPEILHIVDVGWKGTIQDNLHAILCTGDSASVKAIQGYYMGLIGEGAAADSNKKDGLLFSSIRRKSPGFGIFNENRALFETILAADHGSIAGYEIDADGTGRPIRGEYEEYEMIERCIYPMQKQIFQRYSALLNVLARQKHDAQWLLKEAAMHHKRIAFAPTEQEIQWFSIVYHVENFGVFEESRFAQHEAKGFLHRLRFTYRLFFRRHGVDLGFWPWLTISRNGFPGLAHVYRLFRSAPHI